MYTNNENNILVMKYIRKEYVTKKMSIVIEI